MTFRKSIQILSFLAFFAAFFAPLNGVQAQDASKQPVTSVYNFYSGGFHFITGTFSYDNNGQHYEALFEAEPHGFLGSLLPWSTDMSVKGSVKKGDDLTPVHFKNMTAWRDKPETVHLEYNKEGRLVKFWEENQKHGTQIKDVKDNYALGPTDILTSILSVLENGADKACGKSYPVFDGKRRYDVVLGAPQDTMMKASRYNVYEGPAVQCTMTIKEISGFGKKKRGFSAIQEQAKDNDTLPMLWLGHRDGRPNAELVRFQVKTDYGMVIAHLAE